MKKITEITKRDIIDLLVHGKEELFETIHLPLYGRLDELSFLKRLYNLSILPSTDGRFKDAEGDIIQHTLNNDDWDADWVFYDQRFELLYGDDEKFLKFICENFHPAVRKEKGPWKAFLDDINLLLLQDGYEIYESDTISGRSIFDYKETTAPKKKHQLKKGSELRGIFDTYTITATAQFDQGGAARLFEVTDSNGDIHALKVIIGDEKTSSAKIKRFKNELGFLFKHEHDNVVKVTDYGITDDKKGLFYVMPKYHCNLRTIINQGLDEAHILKYFWQICEGLKSAHIKKCWHRDLKPENILYNKDNDSVVIADFGIAHFQENDKTTKIKTKETEKLANFDYHAPEQRKGNIVDGPSADIWAIGLILNEMFTKELAQGIDFKRISDVSHEYGNLDNLIINMLKARPEERCQSVSEVEMLFVTSLGDKNTEFYPELINGVMDFMVYPQKVDLETFVNNDISRRNTIKSIQNSTKFRLDEEVYPLYIAFLTQVIKYIYSTRSYFSEYNAIMKILIDVIVDEKLPTRPRIFLVYIAETFNKIASKIGTKTTGKVYGEAWDATSTWVSNFNKIPQENIQEIWTVAQANGLVYLSSLIKKTIESV